MTTLKEALDQLAKGHELDNEQKKLIIDKWQKELGIQPCVDAISRQAAIDEIKSHYRVDNDLLEVIAYKIGKLPSVQPKYNPDEWCHDCKEYNHDKHCCPRYNKVIRKAVEEMKQPKVGHWIFDEILDRNYYCSECKSMGVDYWDYCPYCGCRMVESQESEGKE